MKKFLATILCLALLLSFAPQTFAAEIAYGVEGGNLYFDTTTGEILYADSTVTAAVIPSEIEGVAVSSIGSFAFNGCELLESVVIPDSVEKVSDHAFMGCDALETVEIGNGVKEIGAHAFLNCAKLTEVIFGASLEHIEGEAFAYCTSLQEIAIPASVTSIGYGAFADCSALTAFRVDEANTVYSSDASGVLFNKAKTMLLQCPGAFAGTYEIADTVTEIASGAFADCTGLTDVIVAQSVIYIGYGAFYNTGLYNDPSNWEDGVLYIDHCLISAIHDFTGECKIREGTVLIADSAFQFCFDLTGIQIPDSVRYINAHAFSETDITSVVLPEGLERIERGMFAYTFSLESVYIPASVTTIGEYAFHACRGLTDVYYGGTQEQWEEVVKQAKNDSLGNAKIHFSDENPEPIDNPFVDVAETDYYYDAVMWAVENGITNGVSETSFAPNENCSRGQIVTFLWRANGSPEPSATENPFADVAETDYYYDAVMWAVENGITNGVSETSFAPNAACTRGQVATFLWRASGKPSPVSKDNPFTDIMEEDYYYTAVLWAVENGITQGVGDGKFAPSDCCTRGQIVTFLYRSVSE